MGDIITFTPRSRPAALAGPEPLAGAALRQEIEAGAQAVLDAADHFIALLDRMDGGADREDGADPEPSLCAPGGQACQVVRLPRCDNDREASAPEPEILDVAIEAGAGGLLPWSGQGNVLTACGAVLLGLVSRR